ncbi:primase-helicase family protein [Ancylobacter sp. IITR112]|uniref:primase-helicase family protein n=1 Tax=Ancylobacter sp. IITR112 TaxID=3138073 RepID=UPI003529F568
MTHDKDRYIEVGGDDAPHDAGRKGKAKAKLKADDTPREPRAMGYSVDAMNREWCVVLMRSRLVIIREAGDGPLGRCVNVLGMDAFRAWSLNKVTEKKDRDGKITVETWADAWLRSPMRREYTGIEFRPGDDAKTTPGYMNMWRGFTVAPVFKKNGYAIFRDHLFNNVCEGDEHLFRWVFGWLAHLVQKPRERIGTALVLRGTMGAGKSKMGEVVGSLIGPHYFAVDDPRYVIDRFNAHLVGCLLLQAEEAFWAGDKVAEGRLKGLVTSHVQMIEEKGVDAIAVDNYVRIMITSNEDWVVPAGMKERRWCVLDVNPRCAQNNEYFREMDEQLDAGGREALLFDLLHFDLSGIDLRRIPRTSGLLEQKLHSLDSVTSWWYHRLESGAPTKGLDRWPEALPVDTLFQDYIETSERIGIRRRAEMTSFGIKMRRLVPGLTAERRTWEIHSGTFKRCRCYVLPDLASCRAALEEMLEQAIVWTRDADAEDEADQPSEGDGPAQGVDDGSGEG